MNSDKRQKIVEFIANTDIEDVIAETEMINLVNEILRKEDENPEDFYWFSMMSFCQLLHEVLTGNDMGNNMQYKYKCNKKIDDPLAPRYLKLLYDKDNYDHVVYNQYQTLIRKEFLKFFLQYKIISCTKFEENIEEIDDHHRSKDFDVTIICVDRENESEKMKISWTFENFVEFYVHTDLYYNESDAEFDLDD